MIELTLLADEAQVEAVSDALMDQLEAVSVSVEDADAETPAEQALFGEPGMVPPREAWQRSTLKALFLEEAQATAAAAWLVAQPEGAGLQVLSMQQVPDQDWVRLTQSQFEPVEITPSFWIVPTWHEVPEQARTVITLDPGLAFGTGTHPTTRMCLRWIATQPEPVRAGWNRILDYGCGSGILAIGAARYALAPGHQIDAVDIDPAAVESTAANAEANGVPYIAAGLPDAAAGRYELVLANILATPLKLLAPLLCAHVAPGGHLVLAGILDRQAEELTQAYAPWCALEVTQSEDGWILMTARL